MLEATGPNAQQIEYWNEVSGPKWVQLNDSIDRLIAPIGARALDLAAPKEGESVLDVGCGCGNTSIVLAERVGSSGRVVGIDISGPMLAEANARRDREGLTQLSFENADAQSHDFSGDRFDLVFSRFGVMFFAEPVVAFESLRKALAPEGRLAFVCWQSPEHNGWMTLPARAAVQHLDPPEPPPPGAPGPFAFADAERLRGILEDAGYGDVVIDGVEIQIDVLGGRSLDDAVDFMSDMGPAGAMIREASPEAAAAARGAIRETLAEHEREGRVELPAAVWLVGARNG